jgi:hypothetical protein
MNELLIIDTVKKGTVESGLYLRGGTAGLLVLGCKSNVGQMGL